MPTSVTLLQVLLIFGLFAGQDSAPRFVHQAAFSVIGITIRTTNAREATNDGVIGTQWQRFYREGILQKIPGKIDSSVYAVYSDYASDRNGEYSFTLGAKVVGDTPVPAGMVLKTVSEGKYAVVTSDRGQVAKVVVAAWQRVWSMEDKRELGPARAYKADFELYDRRAADPQNAQVDLYIGLK